MRIVLVLATILCLSVLGAQTRLRSSFQETNQDGTIINDFLPEDQYGGGNGGDGTDDDTAIVPGEETGRIRKTNDYLNDKESEDQPATLQDEQDKVALENDQLQNNNSDLQEENKNSQEEVIDVQTNLQATEEENSRTIRALEKTIADFNMFNFWLEDQDDEDNDDDGYAVEGSKILIFVVGLGCLFLLFQGCRSFIATKLDDIRRPALQALFLDVTILALLTVLTIVFDWLDVFDEDKIDFKILIVGLSFFTLLWFCLGFWYILIAQAISRKWDAMEIRCRDVKGLLREFADIHERHLNLSASKKEYSNVHRQIQYSVMRQEFICPNHLPTLRESYLRSDFDFAEYLGRCLTNSLTSVYRLSWYSFAAIIMLTASWRLMQIADKDIRIAAFSATPLIFLLILFLMMQKLSSVFYRLVPYIEDPHEIDWPENEYQRNPNVEITELPRPPYLEGRVLPRGNKMGTFGLCCFNFHPLELTFSYIFQRELPNRQQVLFWFDSAGPGFVVYLLQTVTIVLIMWLVVVILYFTGFLSDTISWFSVIVVLACLIVWLFVLGYLVPEVLRMLTMTTSIGHMKDQKTIHKVAQSALHERNLRHTRLYRVLKLVRREFIIKDLSAAERKNLPEFMIMQLRNAFLFHAETEKDFIELSALEDTLKSVGFELSEDEIRTFAKHCTDQEYKITFHRFCMAVESYLREVSLDPQIAVKKVLVRYFQSKLGQAEVEAVSMPDLKEFLETFQWHLVEKDIDHFLHEVRYMLNDESNVSIDEVASLIRDDVEMFAK